MDVNRLEKMQDRLVEECNKELAKVLKNYSYRKIGSLIGLDHSGVYKIFHNNKADSKIELLKKIQEAELRVVN